MSTDGTRSMAQLGTLSDKRARTVESILGAAMLIVAEEGIAALSMSALATRAGVSRQTLYNYFPDVDAVLAGMVAMGDAGTAELAGRLEASSDPRVGLDLFVSTAVESVRSGHPSPMAISAALPAELRQAMQEHEQQAEGVLVELLRRGIADGVFRADLDPELDGPILYRMAMASADLVRRPWVDAAVLARRLSADLLRIVAVAPTHD